MSEKLVSLNEIEPGGPGTIEQRAIRLFIHGQIDKYDLRDFLGFDFRWEPESLPYLKETGCTCPGCRLYCSSRTFII